MAQLYFFQISSVCGLIIDNRIHISGLVCCDVWTDVLIEENKYIAMLLRYVDGKRKRILRTVVSKLGYSFSHRLQTVPVIIS